MKDWIRRGLMAFALLVAGALLVTAFQSDTPEPEESVARGAVLRVFPSPDAVALRQDAIGVDLAFGYAATLTVDDVTIPDDQIDTVSGINRVSFTPGEGKEIESLAEGRHCATVVYSATNPAEASSRGANQQPYSWCFTAA